MEEKMKDNELKEKLDKEIAKEILQDLFTMYICFNIQSKCKNPYIQEIYGYIMVAFYSVFLHELYKANVIDKNPTTKKSKKMIKDFRQRFLKRQAVLGKPHLEEIRKEMGIDFEHFIFDMCLTVDEKNQRKLYSINVGVWDLEQTEKEKVEMFNALANIPEYLIKKLLSESDFKILADNALKAIDVVCEEHANEMDKNMSPIKYPYASAVFFKKPEPQEQDKYIIMYYYSYFSWFSMLDDFVPNLKVEGQIFGMNISYSLMKLKAMFVEMFGDLIRELDTPLTREIKAEFENCFVEKNIYRLNRRLRNNIHYSEVDKLSDSELKRIDDFQRKYIQIVLSIFSRQVKFKFGKRYKFIKWIADNTDSRMREERNRKVDKETEAD